MNKFQSIYDIKLLIVSNNIHEFYPNIFYLQIETKLLLGSNKCKNMKAKLIGKDFVKRIARKDESVMLLGVNNKEEVSAINVCLSRLIYQRVR